MNNPSQSKILVSEAQTIAENFVLLEDVIKDRGSKYSVAAGHVTSREDLKIFLKKLKSSPRYARATHNSWAARLSKDGQIWETKNDDGETGAGMVILRQLQKQDFVNTVVVVTRWFGGEKLHGDRFRHLVEASKLILSQN
ncbi:MAG TPA: YigZ family protein [Candidatus Gracilibacteria bacterium]